MARPGFALSLPVWMVLILAVCLFSMAAHFFLESRGVDGLFSQGPQIAGHYDDTFLIGSLPISGMIGLLMRLISQQPPVQRSFGIPILLPPPNG